MSAVGSVCLRAEVKIPLTLNKNTTLCTHTQHAAVAVNSLFVKTLCHCMFVALSRSRAMNAFILEMREGNKKKKHQHILESTSERLTEDED